MEVRGPYHGRPSGAELQTLKDGLRDVPEVRAEKLADAAAKIDSGYYLTSEAAEKTADVLLRSQD